MANRPSQNESEWVINSRGEKVRNDAYTGPSTRRETARSETSRRKARSDTAMDHVNRSSEDRDSYDDEDYDDEQSYRRGRGDDAMMAAAAGAGAGMGSRFGSSERGGRRGGRDDLLRKFRDRPGQIQENWAEAITNRIRDWFNRIFR